MSGDSAKLAHAARLLRSGELVAFPTETVYGLAANALDEEAVRRIFTAKGRPSTNPLIVHIEDKDGVKRVASEFPEKAQRLADAFWPGPLTLVGDLVKKTGWSGIFTSRPRAWALSFAWLA